MNGTPPDPATDCPRCGYDLSGLVASWTDTCPLEARCSECGLEMRWGEYLRQIRSGPRWSFEHATPRDWWRRLPRTIGRAMWPPSLWKHLALAHQIRIGMLALLLLSALLLTHVFAGISDVLYEHATSRPPWRRSDSVTSVLIWPYDKYGPATLTWICLPVVALSVAAFGVSSLVLGDTFRAAKIRKAHLLRGVAYCTIPASVVAAVLPLVVTHVRRTTYSTEYATAALLLAPLVIGFCWCFFLRDYLKLNALVITPALTIIAVLVVSLLLLPVIAFQFLL